MKRIIKSVLAMSLGVCCLTGCLPAGSRPVDSANLTLIQLQPPEEGQDMAVVTTNVGTIKFVLYEDYAPNTVKQFKALVEEGFYENNPVYAVQKDIGSFFAGALDETGQTGKTATEDGKGVAPEVSESVWHFSGAVSAYGTEEGFLNKKVLADSRFFIVGDQPANAEIVDNITQYHYPDAVIDAYKQLGGVPTITGRYTVFGQVVDGMDVVNAVVNAETTVDAQGNSTTDPVPEIIIEHIELTTYSEEAVSDAA